MRKFLIFLFIIFCIACSTKQANNSTTKNPPTAIWKNSTQNLLGAIQKNDVNNLKTYFDFPIIDSLTRGMIWSHIKIQQEDKAPEEKSFLNEKEFEQHYKTIFFDPKYLPYYTKINLDSVIITGQNSVINNIKKEYFTVSYNKTQQQILLAFEDVISDPTHREEYPNGKLIYFDILKNGDLKYNSTEIID